MSVRRRFGGLVSVEESVHGRDVRVLGLLVWRVNYLARTVEGWLFGRLRVATHDYYPFKISVLMYAHNAEQRIAAAIDSVLAQTFGDFELIVVNDASTDNTASIVRSYVDPRVLLADNAARLGRERCLDLGLGLCRGEYIALVEADGVAASDCFAGEMAGAERAASTPSPPSTPSPLFRRQRSPASGGGCRKGRSP